MFIGIDAGTVAIKAGLFNETGQLLAQGTRPYQTYYPRPGYAEQDPDEWWAALIGAVRDCMAQADISPDAIKGISADATTCTLLPLDANGKPLRRALLWMDVRASEQALRIHETGHPALRYSLAGVSAEWMPPKTLWLKEHEPDTYKNTAHLIEFTDWIAYRLTGRLSLNINTVTQRWYYHTPTGGWDAAFFDTIGLGDVQDKFPADVLPLGAVVDGLSAAAAEELGLPAGIPVAANGGDAFEGILGLGVVEPGDLGVVMGSSNVLSGLSADEFHARGIFGSYPDAVIPGLNLVEGGQVSTTREPEASLLGSGILAAVGAGAFPNTVEASRQMVAFEGEYQPDPANYDAYHFYFDKYRQTYQQLRDIMHDITRKVSN